MLLKQYLLGIFVFYTQKTPNRGKHSWDQGIVSLEAIFKNNIENLKFKTSKFKIFVLLLFRCTYWYCWKLCRIYYEINVVLLCGPRWTGQNLCSFISSWQLVSSWCYWRILSHFWSKFDIYVYTYAELSYKNLSL